MRNFKVMMSYLGTNYHGFQRQDNAVTVQETVEDAVYKLTGEKVPIFGCSRTDTGVHANEFCFSVKLESNITERGVVFGLNGILPDDISIKSAEIAPDGFHARYDCKGKEYIYLIHNSEIKNPFYLDRAYRSWYPIDEKLLDGAAKVFVGTHDFKSLCSTECDKENTIRTIHRFSVDREGDMVKMTVSGDGFLYNMVRIMVGTLLYVNDGKIKADDLPDIISKKSRILAGKTVPPHGLYLNKVYY